MDEPPPSLDVVAFPRRHGVFLAAVLEPAADAAGKLRLCAEDGARFALPERIALLRVSGMDDRGAGESIPQWLDRLRRRLPTTPRWEDVHGRVEAGLLLDVGALAEREGLEGDLGRLALATSVGDASPWFRVEGAHLRAVPGDEARAELARVEAERRASAEDAALVAWWPRRDDDEPTPEAALAIEQLRAFALRGLHPEVERGRVLSARLGLSDADHLLEELVRLGRLPEDANPAAQRARVDRPFSDGARASLAPVETGSREDFRSLVAVAVDDVHTDDPDDAISIREEAGRTEVLVHITDVAAAVPVGSDLDREARARGGTLYVPDGPVTMLPPVLLRERLSLSSGADRPAITGIFTFDDQARLVDRRVVRSLINVTRRVTYDESRDVETLAGTPELGRRLVEIAEALQKERVAGGARILGLRSLKVTLRGGLQAVQRRHGTPGDVVVAEAMVLYNREAARRLAGSGCPAIYRTQTESDRPFPAPGDPLFALLARRAFARTHVAVDAGEHRGIGGGPYLQVTSPLRRYGDLVNQRQLGALADGTDPPYAREQIEDVVRHLSEQERRLRAAADQRVGYWLARLFEDRVGDEVEGVLSRLPRRGRGNVWIPSLCRELPVFVPRGWRPPPVGTPGRFRVERVRPFLGRIELAPVE